MGHDVDGLFSADGMDQVTLEGGMGLGGVEGDMAWENEVFLQLHWRWRNCPKPSIAAVQGRVFADGLMVMWPTDLLVASEDARFADPVTAFGMSAVELFMHPWQFGTRRAKELLLTGDHGGRTDQNRWIRTGPDRRNRPVHPHRTLWRPP